MTGPIENLLSTSSLPNLHALAVHFPVALLSVALLADLACLALRKRVWLDRTAITLYVIGTISAAASFLSGRSASGDMWHFPSEAQAVLADHQDLGLLTLLAYCIVTVLRGIVTWLAREDWRIKIGFFRLLALVASATALVLLALTADRGGALVYQYGMGRTAPSATDGGPPARPDAP
jgi:uncharacterized membrane protein